MICGAGSISILKSLRRWGHLPSPIAAQLLDLPWYYEIWGMLSLWWNGELKRYISIWCISSFVESSFRRLATCYRSTVWVQKWDERSVPGTWLNGRRGGWIAAVCARWSARGNSTPAVNSSSLHPHLLWTAQPRKFSVIDSILPPVLVRDVNVRIIYIFV